jgi:outer membrane protein insertion porin family
MKKSTENLNRLGFFEDAEFQTKKGSADDLMDLTVNVKEKPTGSFSLGAGYSGSEGATGIASVSQNNLFGTGQSLMASLRISTVSQFFDIRYNDPRMWDTQFSGGIDLIKWEYQYDSYTRDSYGGTARLGLPLGLDEYTRGSVSYVYDDTLIKDIASTAPFEIQEMAGWSVTSSMIFSVVRDSKDRPWNTRSGSYNLLSFQYAGGLLGGDIYFNRYEATTQWFIPFYWDSAFMVEGRWGYMQEREGRTIPSYQLYRIGGIATVRGYDQDSISPTAPNGDTIGGPKMMIYNFEYRFPLLKEQGVIGVVFFDMGNVFTQSENYTFTNIPKSAGGGFRWYSPLGPIRLEYGYILNRRPGDPTGNVEFQVGGNW